ncbi:MAG: hypothetical protein WCP58_06225, partial [bacterium]
LCYRFVEPRDVESNRFEIRHTKTRLAAMGVAAMDVAKPVAPAKTPIAQHYPGLRQHDSLRQHVLLG